MKKKIFVILLAAIFVFAQFGDVYAKGFSGRSFSSGSRSFSSKSFGSSSKSFGGSSSKGYSGSPFSSKSSGGSSGSKGYSGSIFSKKSGSSSGTSRSIPKSYSSSGGSYGGSSTSKSTAGSKAGTSTRSTAKSTYMSDAYKKQASQSNFKTYQQKLNSDQQKAYDSSMNRNYSFNNRMNFEDSLRTRPQRIRTFSTRPVFINVNPVYFGSPFSYGYAFVGPWDLFFLMHASDLFFYHHWNDIYPYRDYFQAQKFAELEQRVRQLEQQGVQRDPNYLEPGVDPDLQFSNDYLQKNPDTVYYSNRYPANTGNPIATFIVIAAIVVVLIMIIRRMSRPKPKGPNYSRIY